MSEHHNTLEHPYGARAPMLMGVTWSMAGIAIILTVLRTYTNVTIIRHFCWDYYWAFLALTTGLIGQCFHTIATASGLGNQFDLLSHANQVAALKWSYLGHIPVVNGIGFGKLAVIAFLLRIQDRGSNHKWKNYFLYFMGLSGCAVNLVTAVMLLLQCEPLERQWNDEVPGSCRHVQRTTNAGYFAGSWAAASDVLLAMYPIIVYRKLQISRKDKIALFALLGGGVFAGASSVIKTIYIKLFDGATDKTYTITDLVLWELVECWLVLILGSLPPLRALYLHISRPLNGSSSSASRFRSRQRRCNMHPGHNRFSMNRQSALSYHSNHQQAMAMSAKGKKSPGHSHGNSNSNSNSDSYGNATEDLVDGTGSGISNNVFGEGGGIGGEVGGGGVGDGRGEGEAGVRGVGVGIRVGSVGGAIMKTTNIRISHEERVEEGEVQGKKGEGEYVGMREREYLEEVRGGE